MLLLLTTVYYTYYTYYTIYYSYYTYYGYLLQFTILTTHTTASTLATVTKATTLLYLLTYMALGSALRIPHRVILLYLQSQHGTRLSGNFMGSYMNY